MVGGVALLTLNDAILKALSERYPIGQMLFLRGLFVFVPIAILAWRAGGRRSLRVRNVGGQLARALLTISSTFLFVTGLSLMPLADAIAIVIAGPLFVTALARPVLHEHVGWRRWLAVGVGLAGVLIMLRPGTSALRWAALFPLVGAFMGAMRDVVTRELCASDSSTAILCFTTVAVTVGGLLTWPLGWQVLETRDLLAFAASGMLLGAAHFLLIETFRFAQAALVAPFKFTNLVWAVLFGFLIWGDLPDRWVVLGASIVVASGLYILHRETGGRRTT